jgi:hypothetical protein
MKRTDLEKNKGLKIASKMKQAGTPGRFGDDAGNVVDKREQRKRDQAAGLVPFAVKLDGELVKQLRAMAEARQTGLSEVVTELLRKGLAG